MKILLINDNPVVGKLVTLSAQKTGDELTSVSSMQEVGEGQYDLLIVDDACFDKEQLAALSGTLKYSKSCFIGSRTTERPEGFSRELNKPFLPTDLVEIFAEISSGLAKQPVSEPDDMPELGLDEDFEDSLENFDDLDETLGDLDEAESLDAIEVPDAIAEESTDMDLDLEGLLDEEDDSDLLSLDEDLDDLVDEVSSSAKSESILDEEDVKEVKSLLDEAEEELLDEAEELMSQESDVISERPMADEATLNEINKALEELDKIEDDDSMSLDDALNELGIEPAIPVAAEEDLIDESILSSLEEVLTENLESLDLEEESSTDTSADVITDELDDILEDELLTQENVDVTAQSDEEMQEDEAADLITDDLDTLLEDDSFAEEDSDAIAEPEEDLIQEDSADVIDDDLSRLLSEADEDSESTELDELSDDDDFEDESLESEVDDLITEDEEDPELDALLEEIAEEEEELLDLVNESAEESLGEDTSDDEEVDLSALNDEIKEALEGLDEDDLESELEDLDAIADIDNMDDVFSSLSSNELKLALGEEVTQEEIDEEEAKIQEEIEELESSLEEEEEIALKVGQSEYASLNEEALYEAMGEDIEGDNEHPELEEIDAFVDAIAVEGAAGERQHAGTDENIVALEELIATLKQANVKEALKGMKMNISISFSEKNG